MGYRCPKCHKDFGMDKEALNTHFLENPQCSIVASTMYSMLRQALDSINNDEED